ncbi:hypothetical protein P2H44_03505 [Albimonas sp. CAU 1670]|uniref:hypothetical protein n=1 Tax=Albimonas sp. CAU 1670 TaxID=3032599 RepID=UPI0023D9F8C3|nr:hypothetical protein [Albimonas sp. CAU 1670]MDF2231611.1 hypothetical protein [Albimonas sp. CAU 1670]
MSRLDGPGSAGGGAFSARDRYATSRIVTSVLFAAGAFGLTALHFHIQPNPDLNDPGGVYIAAAASGAIAAWKGIGTNLGRGLWVTLVASLASAAIAGVLFSVLAGVRAVLKAYEFTHFSTAEALVAHLLTKAVETGEALIASPALIPALIAAVVAGLLGELARRAWDRVVIAPT